MSLTSSTVRASASRRRASARGTRALPGRGTIVLPLSICHLLDSGTPQPRPTEQGLEERSQANDCRRTGSFGPNRNTIERAPVHHSTPLRIRALRGQELSLRRGIVLIPGVPRGLGTFPRSVVGAVLGCTVWWTGVSCG